MQLFWKLFCQFLKILNRELAYDPEIPLLGKELWKLKIYVHTRNFTWKFAAALFIIAKDETTEISMNRWIN